MKLCFYFQVHQPTRLNKLSILDFCKNGDLKQMYFNERKNREILLRVAEKCYLPTNRLMIGLINKYNIKFALSLSGVFIEQCQEYAPAVLDSFNALAETGNVEFIDETYYHSLASLHKDKNEFIEQIKEHAKIIKRLFNQKPTAFRNTELIYSNEIAGIAESLGYKTILAEGINLGWRSPNYVYRPRGCSKIKLLLRNYMLSDDVSFRFSAHAWSGYPLTADKYASWLSHCTGDVINIFMDYETFGEHQWKETGIFEFLRHLPAEIKKYNLEFATPEEIEMEPAGEYDAPNVTSWADLERDTSAWLGNDMQKSCFNEMEKLGALIKQKNDKKLLRIWRLLQTTDHIYYISTKKMGDEEVHKYFAEHQSPYEAFINYMNIIQHLKGLL